MTDLAGGPTGGQSAGMRPGVIRTFALPDEAATSRFAAALAPLLGPGDTLLLQGGLGAGKTHFARGLIQARLGAHGLAEDVPSPTFTLVQTYWDGEVEIWHCDLYRLSGAEEVVELGLDDALDQAICLVEWPERMPAPPKGALTLEFSMGKGDTDRTVVAASQDARWRDILDRVGLADG